MHIVRFQGGFANQIFQLCLFNKLVEEYGQDNVWADLSHYKSNKDHGGFKLGRFATLRTIKRMPDEIVHIDENNFFSVAQADVNKSYYYNGYWQDEAFFPDDINFVRDIVAVNSNKKSIHELLTKIVECESVSVHVRRGDYVNNYLHGNIANTAYYKNAIGYMKQKLENPVFFIFSDDIDWCKANIVSNDSSIYYIDDNANDVQDDIFLMSSCKHNIIANSSFSWWAQRLNNNNEKMVIAPKYWYNYENAVCRLNNECFVHVNNYLTYDKPKDNPIFSILVPVYNQERNVRRCLASVLNQTVENIEIIAVDDGSTDSSAELLQEYASVDKRLKIIHKDNNESLLMARITAMEQASGRYVLFVDSDDYIDEKTCERLLKEYSKTNCDILEFAYVREPDKKIVNNYNKDNCSIERILDGSYPHMVWNKCYSYGVIKASLKIIDKFYCNMAEDYYLSVVFALCNKLEVRSIDDGLYHYVDTDGMSNSISMTEKELDNSIESICNKNDHLKKILDGNCKYLELLDESIKSDLASMDDRIRNKLELPIQNRIRYLSIIDGKFNTNYREIYEKDIEEALRLKHYCDIHGLKGYCKLLIKNVVSRIKREFSR